jgi:hypothetical protein
MACLTFDIRIQTRNPTFGHQRGKRVYVLCDIRGVPISLGTLAVATSICAMTDPSGVVDNGL